MTRGSGYPDGWSKRLETSTRRAGSKNRLSNISPAASRVCLPAHRCEATQGENMNAMPQLSDAESKFFESGGQETAPSLSEGLPETPESQSQVEAGDQDWIPASAGMTDEEEEVATPKSASGKEIGRASCRERV